MQWFRGSWVKWAFVATGLLSTSCAGAIGAGAAAVVVGAGVLAFTCYDRVSVTVTDRLTGTTLCDAKVTFFEGKSETEATSCYQAALSAGKYRMRVERRGLETYEEPIEVTKGGKCGQSVQTMYIALERKRRGPAPEQYVVESKLAGAPKAAAAASAAAPQPAAAAPAAPTSSAPASAAAPVPAPAPAPTAFPDAQ